ncbi:MAG: hypothetical protein KGS46_21425 [Chloroflexi bacterium]|nr:hypothetical protein [Chloroflexota bacterium]
MLLPTFGTVKNAAAFEVLRLSFLTLVWPVVAAAVAVGLTVVAVGGACTGAAVGAGAGLAAGGH